MATARTSFLSVQNVLTPFAPIGSLFFLNAFYGLGQLCHWSLVATCPSHCHSILFCWDKAGLQGILGHSGPWRSYLLQLSNLGKEGSISRLYIWTASSCQMWHNRLAPAALNVHVVKWFSAALPKLSTWGILEASLRFAVVFRSFHCNYDGTLPKIKSLKMQFSIDQTNNISITMCCDLSRLRGQVNDTLTALASQSLRLEAHTASYIWKGGSCLSYGRMFYSVRMERVCILCVDRTHE